MKPSLKPWALCLALSTAFPLPVPSAADASAKEKPVLLYSRYFNAEGESRYLPDGTFKEILEHLREEFDVRVHREPITKETLAGVNLLLIANPSDKPVAGQPPPHHFSAADQATLDEYVQGGGGLILLGNQEDHNLEVEDTNRLLSRFGLQFTNLYTDAKKLLLPKETSLIGGLRWAYYTGNLLTLELAHPAKPRPLIQNDLAQKPIKGRRDTPGTLLAVANPGRGHVVVATDAGWLTADALSEKGIGGVAIKGQDNWEIFRRLSRWAAGADRPR